MQIHDTTTLKIINLLFLLKRHKEFGSLLRRFKNLFPRVCVCSKFKFARQKTISKHVRWELNLCVGVSVLVILNFFRPFYGLIKNFIWL